jgi:hypothetical protein
MLCDSVRRRISRCRTYRASHSTQQLSAHFAQDTTMSETTPMGQPGLARHCVRSPRHRRPSAHARIRARTNGTVIMFICNHCPYVKAVVGKIVRDMNELREHGVGSIAISSNDPPPTPRIRSRT